MGSLFLRSVSVAVIGLGLAGGGCASILGLGDYQEGEGGGGASPTSTVTSSSVAGPTSTTSTGTTTTASASVSTSASDSSSSTGMTFCEPGMRIACYDGPANTENHGTCRAGTQTCEMDGSAYGPCEGSIVPQPQDDCTTMSDTNCDDTVSCACTPNQSVACYEGTPGTQNHGTCVGGMRTCDAQGQGFGACVGQVVDAVLDDCATGADENCDDVVNDLCTCVPNSTSACYSGPGGTSGVGLCHGGMHTCNATGTAFGSCVGEVVPGVENCDALGDENCDASACGDSFWSRLLQTNMIEDYALTESIDTDFAGAIIVAGNMVKGATGTIDLGGTTLSESYIAKYTAAGALAWSKQPPANIDTMFVASSGNSFYVYGEYFGTITLGGSTFTSAGQGDLYVVAYDTNGNQQWARTFGGTGSDVATDIVQSGGSLVITGSFNGPLTFPGQTTMTPQNRDTFVTKLLASNGSVLWSRQIGDAPSQPANDQNVYGVAIDAGGSIYAGGAFSGTMRLAGTNYTAQGSGDAFLTKMDTNGTALWGRVYGGVAGDRIEEVAVDSAGSPIIAGYVGGSVNFGGGALAYGGGSRDGFVAKIDTAGTHVWSRAIAGPGFETGQDVDVDGMDNVIVAFDFGTTASIAGKTFIQPANNNVAFVKLDSAGAYRWGRSQSDGLAFAPHVATGPMNRIAVAFFNEGTVDLGNGPLTSVDEHDSLVVGVLQP